VELYPAIDLLNGRVVQLRQGAYDAATDYGEDPVAVASAFVSQGAPWLHMVDLDAARTGHPANRPAIEAVVAAVAVPVQVGGGVRDEGAAEALLGAGVRRVVLGTAATEEPALVARLAKRHPGRIAVGLDARAGQVAVRGWTEGTGTDVLDVLARFEDAGVAAFVVTEIARDGTLEGPDLPGLRAALGATAVPVVASGGVGSLEDLVALRHLEVAGRRLSGAIVGTAIHDGRFTVAEAVEATASGPKELVRQAYERLGDDYKAHDHDVLGWLDRTLAGVAAGTPVLDLGCGDGLPAARHLVDRGYEVTGFDLSARQVERARTNVPEATFGEADMTQLDLPSAAFGAVVALYSVLHVPAAEQPALVGSIARWLRPGGRLLLVVGDTAWSGVGDFHGQAMYWGDAGPAAVERWLADAGLTVAWRHREPEPPGAHIVYVAERQA